MIKVQIRNENFNENQQEVKIQKMRSVNKNFNENQQKVKIQKMRRWRGKRKPEDQRCCGIPRTRPKKSEKNMK